MPYMLVDGLPRHGHQLTGPISLLEIFWILCNVSLTVAFIAALRVRGKKGTGPLSAERSIEDDVVIREVARDVAIALEVGSGDSPRERLRLPRGYVVRNGAPGEEPNLDGGIRPFHGEYAPTVLVELGVGSRGLIGVAAARVGLVRGVLPAIIGEQVSGLAGAGGRAAFACVEGH